MKTLKNAFNAGMESFAKHCLTYGTITYDDSYPCDVTGKPCRVYLIDIQGAQAQITKRCGKVIAVSYDEACYA